jgi:3-methyladenine DNA glycosylase Mpg
MRMAQVPDRQLFAGKAVAAAKRLIGMEIVYLGQRARIVETEA